jgi:hypothetical protein
MSSGSDQIVLRLPSLERDDACIPIFGYIGPLFLYFPPALDTLFLCELCGMYLHCTSCALTMYLTFFYVS